MRFYVDNIERDTNSAIFTIASTTDDLKIGKRFNGTIDEVSIYNRSLSPEQINENYLANNNNQNSRTILSNETDVGETWQACVTPTDLEDEGTTVCSNELTILSQQEDFANETEGDIAIEQGILNAIPTATIHDEQQAYIRLNNGTQELGQFDRSRENIKRGNSFQTTSHPL